jgi:hypothetical protein
MSRALAGCFVAVAFCIACSSKEESPRERVVGRWVFNPEEAIARTEVSIRADEGNFTGGLLAGKKYPEPDELRSQARELAKNLEGAILDIKDDGSFTSVTKWVLRCVTSDSVRCTLGVSSLSGGCVVGGWLRPSPRIFEGIAPVPMWGEEMAKGGPRELALAGASGWTSSTVDLAIPWSVASPQSRPPFRQGFRSWSLVVLRWSQCVPVPSLSMGGEWESGTGCASASR